MAENPSFFLPISEVSRGPSTLLPLSILPWESVRGGELSLGCTDVGNGKFRCRCRSEKPPPLRWLDRLIVVWRQGCAVVWLHS
jgi:hypothetical protein